jgi:drug/metabolite transporter (DMT)-like permease
VIIFTGLLSVAFLERILKKAQWIGIFFILIGLTVVGLSDFLFASKKPEEGNLGINSIVTGKRRKISGKP